MAKKPPYGYNPNAAADDGRKPIGVWIAVGLLAVAAIVGIVVAATASEDKAAGEDTQPVTVSGTRLVPLPASGEDPAVGKEIPTLEGKSFDGTPVTIEPGGGPQIIAFLAHWCPHCQAEVPQLVSRIADGTIPDSIRVTAVSTAVDKIRGNYPPSSWLAAEDFPGPVLADDENQAAGTAFGLGGFPYLVVTDAEGKVVKRTSGELAPEQYAELVAAALGESGADSSVISSGESSPAPAAP